MTRRLFAVLTLTLGLLLSLTSAAGADFKDGTVNISELSANPASASYSPYAWTSTWSPTAADYDELANGDLKEGLISTGLIIGDGDHSVLFDVMIRFGLDVVVLRSPSSLMFGRLGVPTGRDAKIHYVCRR